MSDTNSFQGLKKRFARMLSLKKSDHVKVIRGIENSFTLADLKKVPPQWTITGPYFVGIGAPKAGTSWWYSLLYEHPQIVGHRLSGEINDRIINKELQFFPHIGHKVISESQLETYRQAFAAPEGAICGEFSVQYFCYPHCLNHLSQASPSAKIVLLLRNPIDRMLSHINHLYTIRLRNQKFNPKQLYVYKTFSLYTEATLHSLYAHPLKQLLRYFDRSQILVLQYEKCKKNPDAEIARTYEFLGIDATYQPQNIRRSINQKKYIIEQLTAEERSNLAAYFVDDVKASVELFPEIDLSLWSDFAN
jgi:hypothetical protein